MNVLLRALWVVDTATAYIRLRRRLGILPSDLVLDVGSGTNPNPRANVLCDKFVDDGVERHGTALLVDRPFVVGDVQQLPFADQAFDFVICSHVLEHVPDPAAAISELQRVAPRGYVETPSAEWERLAGFPFHRWMVSYRDGRLRFDEKHAPVEDGALRDWFCHFQRALHIEQRAWFARHRIGVYTWLLWEREIPFEVHRMHEDRDAGFVSADLSPPDGSLRTPDDGAVDRVLAWLGARSRARSNPSAPRLASLLRCPACGGRMVRQEDRYGCVSCPKCYEIKADGRPWLIA